MAFMAVSAIITITFIDFISIYFLQRYIISDFNPDYALGFVTKRHYTK
jgi:hypothetical protein